MALGCWLLSRLIVIVRRHPGRLVSRVNHERDPEPPVTEHFGECKFPETCEFIKRLTSTGNELIGSGLHIKFLLSTEKVGMFNKK